MTIAAVAANAAIVRKCSKTRLNKPNALILRVSSTLSRLENVCPLRYCSSMKRDDVIARLKETEPALRAFGVEALYLFGSHARDEAGPESDVDVFIDCRAQS